jgi:hypothetical protein
MTAFEVIKRTLEQRLLVCSPLISMDVSKAAQEIADALVSAGHFGNVGEQAAASTSARRPPTASRLGDAPEFGSVQEAIEFANSLVEDARAIAGEKPIGADFLNSVADSASSLAMTIQQRNNVTAKQAGALVNWRAGVDRWLG